MKPPTSADIRHLYTRDYYMHHVHGHAAFRNGDGGLPALLNMRRTFALALTPALREVTDIGSGRGELARHLVQNRVAVTLVDYSEAAMDIAREFVADGRFARYLVISATELADHVRPASQDAIFMVDFAEHVSREELRAVLAACAEVLAPDGALCLHSPEHMSGAVLSDRAVEPKHINLMDIDDLHALLAEAFPYADAFTWNGGQRFDRPGRCIELFGIGRNRAPRVHVDPAATLLPGGGWRTSFPGAATAGAFHVRAVVRPVTRYTMAHARVRFLIAGGVTLEHTVRLDLPAGEPGELFLASAMLPDADSVPWERVDQLEVELKEAAMEAPPSVATASE